MTTHATAPVLVTGSHRSGTTWVGRLLAAAEPLHYVQEPFNIVEAQRWMVPRPTHQFLYIDESNAAHWRAPMERVMSLRYPLVRNLATRPPARVARRMVRVARDAAQARRDGASALVKDPIAVFSTLWMVREFGVTAVVLVRDPVAFVGSLVARNWGFDFRHWLEQPRLMADCLQAAEPDVRRLVEHPTDDLVTQGIVMWNAIYGWVESLLGVDPRVMVISYERLASNPEVEVEGLYARLGLEFGPTAAATVRQLSSGSSGPVDAIDVRRDSRSALSTWKDRLGADEVARIRRETSPRWERLSAAL
jgi:hypothetical protein